jgi:hypothetical protein
MKEKRYQGEFFRRKDPMKNPQPVHVPGTMKGEELALHKGKEPGRGRHGGKGYRCSRDSTGIDPAGRRPIHPSMPNIPPA